MSIFGKILGGVKSAPAILNDGLTKAADTLGVSNPEARLKRAGEEAASCLDATGYKGLARRLRRDMKKL